MNVECVSLQIICREIHILEFIRKGHNLDRARTQFKLVADMESKWQEMNSIIENNKILNYIDKLGR